MKLTDRQGLFGPLFLKSFFKGSARYIRYDRSILTLLFKIHKCIANNVPN